MLPGKNVQKIVEREAIISISDSSSSRDPSTRKETVVSIADTSSSSNTPAAPKDLADLQAAFWLCSECLGFWGIFETKYVQQYLREKNACMAERQIFSQRNRDRCAHCNGVRHSFMLFLEGEETHHWEEYTGDAHIGRRWVYLGAQYVRLVKDAPEYPGLEVTLRPLKDGYAPPRIFEFVTDDPDYPSRPSSADLPEETLEKYTARCIARQKAGTRYRPSFFYAPPAYPILPLRVFFLVSLGRAMGRLGHSSHLVHSRLLVSSFLQACRKVLEKAMAKV